MDFGSHYVNWWRRKTEMQYAMLIVMTCFDSIICILVVMWCNKIVLGDRAQYEWLLVLLGWEIIKQDIELMKRKRENMATEYHK